VTYDSDGGMGSWSLSSTMHIQVSTLMPLQDALRDALSPGAFQAVANLVYQSAGGRDDPSHAPSLLVDVRTISKALQLRPVIGNFHWLPPASEHPLEVRYFTAADTQPAGAQELMHISWGLRRWLGVNDLPASGGSSGSGGFRTPSRARAPAHQSAGMALCLLGLADAKIICASGLHCATDCGRRHQPRCVHEVIRGLLSAQAHQLLRRRRQATPQQRRHRPA
jgi:hypothetical protein